MIFDVSSQLRHARWNPHRDQEQRVPSGRHPVRRRGADPSRPRGRDPGRRRRRLSNRRQRFQGRGRATGRHRGRSVGRGRSGAQGQEPQPIEYGRMRRGQTLFTYLHLAASRACTDALLASATTSIAYETVQTADGALPLLAPMSEVAGRLSAQVGAYHLMRTHGGRGVLMGGVPGVEPAKVVVIGGGTAGCNAARVADGMGAMVTVLDVNINRLRELDTE